MLFRSPTAPLELKSRLSTSYKRMSTHTTHAGVAIVAPRAPLQIIQVPDVKPSTGQVRVEVHWVGSSPLDLHQADGGLGVTPPQILGDTAVGVVVEAGEGVEHLKVGDQVFGFLPPVHKQPAQQEFITVPAYLLGKLPETVKPEAAATVPSSLVTTWHALTTDLSIDLPYPKPSSYTPPNADAPILTWGASSSVGQYVLQVLKHYGYTNIPVTASPRHHELLRSLGATETYDYNSPDDLDRLREALESQSQQGVRVKVLDNIGSVGGSMEPLARITPSGSLVAVLLPVIKIHAEEDRAPEYSMDTQSLVKWKEGVQTVGVRTHFYAENDDLKRTLQPLIMPELLAQGVITPNKTRIVEGRTLLERAQSAIDILRKREVSGERLVWRVKQA